MTRRGPTTHLHICDVLVVVLELHQICLHVFRTCFELHVKVDEGSAYRGDNRSSGDWVHSAEGRILCMGLFQANLHHPAASFFLIIEHLSIEAHYGAALILSPSSFNPQTQGHKLQSPFITIM